MMSNKIVDGKPLVWIGVFAHPDDETTSSSGTMMKWVKKNNEAYIITGTRGEEGTLGTGDLKIKREDLGKVREEELRHNLDLYGVNPPYIFNYRDQDLDKGLLNINSPLARALIGKEEGDEVEVNTPGGVKHYEIIKIEYN